MVHQNAAQPIFRMVWANSFAGPRKHGIDTFLLQHPPDHPAAVLMCQIKQECQQLQLSARTILEVVVELVGFVLEFATMSLRGLRVLLPNCHRSCGRASPETQPIPGCSCRQPVPSPACHSGSTPIKTKPARGYCSMFRNHGVNHKTRGFHPNYRAGRERTAIASGDISFTRIAEFT